MSDFETVEKEANRILFLLAGSCSPDFFRRFQKLMPGLVEEITAERAQMKPGVNYAADGSEVK